MKATFLAAFLILLSSCSSNPGRELATQASRSNVRCDKCEEAMGREERGFRNNSFESIFATLIANHPAQPVEEDHKINSYQLLKAARTIVARDQNLNTRNTIYLTNSKGQRVPTEIFLSLDRQLSHAFASLGLGEDQIEALVQNILAETIRASFLKVPEYFQQIGKAPLKEGLITELVKDAGNHLISTSKIEARYDVPYIGGYSDRDEKFVFIDRHVPTQGTFKGIKIPAHFLLNVHERIEKILLVKLGLTYQNAHQIAQRSERRAAKGFGIEWDDYDEWLGSVTQRVAEDKPLRIHPHLDMICYYSYNDEDNLALVEDMEIAKRNWRK
jgi:hypothetical protein